MRIRIRKLVTDSDFLIVTKDADPDYFDTDPDMTFHWDTASDPVPDPDSFRKY
jgi:hypothetical protein